MKILSIETSCDDTGITIMEATGGIKNPSFQVLGDIVSSQISIHAPYGGVYPKLAKREHIKNLPILLEKVLKRAKLNKKNKPVDMIAVTYGPGLEPALWTGIVFGKELAKKWKKPLVPVNHMEGHIFSPFGKKKPARNASPASNASRSDSGWHSDAGGGKFKIPKVKLPMLVLLISGGHTELVLVEKFMNYKIIGETLDDAVGEAFDKVARMLGLPYPGGPEISKLAKEARKEKAKGKSIFTGSLSMRARIALPLGSSACETPRKNYFPFALPRPMLHSKNFDFSFSGLKTAVLYLIRDIGPLDKKMKAQIALEFENAAIECLTYKTKKAIEKYKIKTLIVAGGVAANNHLKKEIQKIVNHKSKNKIKLLFPKKELTGDNSLMIGIAGYLNFIKNKKRVPKLDSIKAIGNLKLG